MKYRVGVMGCGPSLTLGRVGMGDVGDSLQSLFDNLLTGASAGVKQKAAEIVNQETAKLLQEPSVQNYVITTAQQQATAATAAKINTAISWIAQNKVLVGAGAAAAVVGLIFLLRK